MTLKQTSIWRCWRFIDERKMRSDITLRDTSMLQEHRGLGTARILLHAPKPSDGYTALWERKRLDLTVEALIIEDRWHALFSDEEREIAHRRLQDYNWLRTTRRTWGQQSTDRCSHTSSRNMWGKMSPSDDEF